METEVRNMDNCPNPEPAVETKAGEDEPLSYYLRERRSKKKRKHSEAKDKKKPLSSMTILETLHKKFKLDKYAKEKEGKYPCPFCTIKFHTPGEVILHEKAKHKDKFTFECEHCEDKFADIDQKNCHYEKAHGVTRFVKCTICELPFVRVNFHCQVAHRTDFPRDRHADKPYKAPRKKVKKFKEDKEKSKSRRSKSSQSSSSPAKSRTKRVIKAKPKKKSKPKPKPKKKAKAPEDLSCQDCRRIFPTKQGLSQHKRLIKKSSAKMRCQQCKKQFKLQSCLLFHRKAAHPDAKKFKCEFCGRNYATKSLMKSHAKSHQYDDTSSESSFEWRQKKRKSKKKAKRPRRPKGRLVTFESEDEGDDEKAVARVLKRMLDKVEAELEPQPVPEPVDLREVAGGSRVLSDEEDRPVGGYQLRKRRSRRRLVKYSDDSDSDGNEKLIGFKKKKRKKQNDSIDWSADSNRPMGTKLTVILKRIRPTFGNLGRNALDDSISAEVREVLSGLVRSVCEEFGEDFDEDFLEEIIPQDRDENIPDWAQNEVDKVYSDEEMDMSAGVEENHEKPLVEPVSQLLEDISGEESGGEIDEKKSQEWMEPKSPENAEQKLSDSAEPVSPKLADQKLSESIGPKSPEPVETKSLESEPKLLESNEPKSPESGKAKSPGSEPKLSESTEPKSEELAGPALLEFTEAISPDSAGPESPVSSEQKSTEAEERKSSADFAEQKSAEAVETESTAITNPKSPKTNGITEEDLGAGSKESIDQSSNNLTETEMERMEQEFGKEIKQMEHQIAQMEASENRKQEKTGAIYNNSIQEEGEVTPKTQQDN